MGTPSSPHSYKAEAYLQLCRNGKADEYGDLLFEAIQSGEKLRTATESREIDAYREIARAKKLRDALQHWRNTGDEASAEIVYDSQPTRSLGISVMEAHRVWYDCSARKARRYLDNILDYKSRQGRTYSEMYEDLHKLHLLTLDIPTETGRDFPYHLVVLGWPGGSSERTVKVHAIDAIAKMIQAYKNEGNPFVKEIQPGQPDPGDMGEIRLMLEHWGISWADLESYNL